MVRVMEKLVLVVLTATVLIGCEGMLDVEPRTFSSASGYYENEEQIERGVNGAYGELQNIYNATIGFWAMTEMRSDNTSYQFNVADRGEQQMEELDEFLITPDNNDIEEIWSNIYSGILQCNTVLNRIDEVEFSEQNTKDQFKGEMHFLRAFHYFNLVRLYGGVPLVLEEVRSPEAAFNERAGIEEVYEQIIADADSAAVLLPEEYSRPDAGRATKGSALTLLGEVYMTRRQFTEAIPVLEEVTGLGYSLLPDYTSVFDPANKNHSESIFEVQYSSSQEGEHSNYIYRFVPFNSGSDVIGFTDLSTSFAGYNIPTHDMVQAYEESDERKEASVSFYINPDNEQYPVALGDSIPFINKYNHEFEEQGRTDDNWPVYRYAHVLLMLAEALNEEDRTSEAYPYINEVRSRAGLSSLSGLTQSEFREAVYHELRVELAFENHRWFNLLRTNRAIEVMTAHGEEEKGLKSRLSNAAYDIQAYKLLYPIPQREVRLNNLEQNPEW